MSDYVFRYSLDNREKITIMYMKGLNITQRDIKVKRIDEDYIIAYCYSKKAIRRFTKDNILSSIIPELGIGENDRYKRANQ